MIRFNRNDSLTNSDLLTLTGSFNFTFKVSFYFIILFYFIYYFCICNCRLKTTSLRFIGLSQGCQTQFNLQTYTDDNVQYTHTYTQYTQCTIRHTYSYQYTLYTICTHSTLCTHICTHTIYIHSNVQWCSRLYISWIRKLHVCALDGIQW